MFLGQFHHTLDYKGRLSIPKKFRDEIKAGVLTRGLDNCLFLYSKEEWEALSNRIRQLPLTASSARSFSRYLFSGAIDSAFDKLGRITLPDYLKEHAQIDKNVVIIGVLNRVEIWAEKNWEEFNQKARDESSAIAEKLSESGI